MVRTSIAKAAIAASALAAAFSIGGRNTFEQAINQFTNMDETDMKVKCTFHGDEDTCLFMDKYDDVFNQCTRWESGIALCRAWKDLDLRREGDPS